MSQIHIRKKHKLDHALARKTAEVLAERLASEYNARYQWHNDELQFESTAVNGKLHVSKDEVDIKVSLGMLLRPLKGRIENSIRSRLDDILG
ncbi:MAG TPA: polyhydroxyalkanoic acid system family protein [Gammaproteobacteria bacterium]|nr:polyhydroxyalkanoic acid system family protein [Gammaproteobacteria bacterium]